jgi:two-component system sensor histidine kinase ChvG
VPTDLSALLDELLDNLRSSLRERDIHLHSAVQPQITVALDHELFETAIENLLENAADFTPPNGTVRIELRRNGQQAELRIEDQGPGVPPDDLERIFERYYSSRPDGVPTGHPVHFGIGLWIVRRNIDALGGRIEAQNRQQGGLSMQVHLPLSR